MSESKHTRGPLVVHHQPSENCFIVSTPFGIVKTAQCFYSRKNADDDRDLAKADATLYASAPDLLEALKAVNAIVSEAAMTGFNWKDGDWVGRLFASQWNTSEAIRKAEGRELKTLAVLAKAEGRDE